MVVSNLPENIFAMSSALVLSRLILLRPTLRVLATGLVNDFDTNVSVTDIFMVVVFPMLDWLLLVVCRAEVSGDTIYSPLPPLGGSRADLNP